MLLKIAYKEPRPFWIKKEITAYRCYMSHDFEGPSDHMYILMFMGTYINLLFLRKYSPKHPRTYLSNFFFLVQGLLMLATIWAGLILGHTYCHQSIIGFVFGGFSALICL